MNAIATITDLAATAVLVDFAAASRPVSGLAKQIAADAAARLEMEKKKGGIQGLAAGRQDMFRINPYLLAIKADWNSREMTDPANLAHIDALARSIAEVGVKEPLTVYSEGGILYVSNGHSRLLAVFRAIEVYGAEIKTIPVKTEDKYASEADRILTQIISNSGKPLTPFEQGKVFKKLIALGWSEKQIAEKAALSVTRVVQLLELQSAPEAVKDMVRNGRVSATLAWQTIKAAEGDDRKVVQELSTALATAQTQGKAKATAKHLSSAPRVPVKKTLKEMVAAATVEKNADDGKVSIILTADDYATLLNLLGL